MSVLSIFLPHIQKIRSLSLHQKLFLFILIPVFVFIHFFLLSKQEFLGDEASPMLLIDRMWDGVRLGDVRFLAYPFLFYHDPFRAIFSGTMLTLFGPDRILTRLPSIVWDFLTLTLLYKIFLKERISLWIAFLLLFLFVMSGISMNGRLAGGDAQARFLILITGYLSGEALAQKDSKLFFFGTITWCMGMVTMLNTVILLPALGLSALVTKAYKNRKIRVSLFFLCIALVLYFFLWAYFPLQAFNQRFQQHYGNRGLWYYISRVSEGTSNDPFKSVRALNYYTSPSFTILIIISLLGLPFTPRWKDHGLVIYPAIIAVFLLNRSSFHVLMYTGLFLYSIGIVINWASQRNKKMEILVTVFLCIVAIHNSYNLVTQFLFNFSYPTGEFIVGHINVSRSESETDEAVKRIYTEHVQ